MRRTHAKTPYRTRLPIDADTGQILRAICNRHPGFSFDAHAQRLLEALSSVVELTVKQIEMWLTISNAPALVNRLRKKGTVIHSEWVVFTDVEGNTRRTTAYKLG